MPIHRMEGITYGERGVSLTMIPGMTLHNSVNNNKLCGGPQPQLRPRLEIRQLYKQRPNETLTIKVSDLSQYSIYPFSFMSSLFTVVFGL